MAFVTYCWDEAFLEEGWEIYLLPRTLSLRVTWRLHSRTTCASHQGFQIWAFAVVTKYAPTLDAIDCALPMVRPALCIINTHSRGTIPWITSVIEWGPGKMVSCVSQGDDWAAATSFQKKHTLLQPAPLLRSEHTNIVTSRW